jgi:hypothetical protein
VASSGVFTVRIEKKILEFKASQVIRGEADRREQKMAGYRTGDWAVFAADAADDDDAVACRR